MYFQPYGPVRPPQLHPGQPFMLDVELPIQPTPAVVAATTPSVVASIALPSPGDVPLFYSGAWSSTQPYVPGELVQRNGGTYISLVASINTDPSSATGHWLGLGSGGGGGGGGGGSGVALAAPPVIVATSLANLQLSLAALQGATPVDGQACVLRLGGAQDQFDVLLVYNALRGKWVQPGNGFEVIRTTEQNRFIPLGLGNVDLKQYIPFNNSPQGWGFTAQHQVGVALAAGLQLEYRHHGFLRPNPPHGFSLGCYFYPYNQGEVANTAYTNPPSLGWAETDYLYSGTTTSAFYNFEESAWMTLKGPISPDATNTTTGTHLALAPLNALSLYPAIYGRMDAGSQAAGDTNGGFLNYSLFLRLVL